MRARRCEKLSSAYGGFEQMSVARVADVTVLFHRSAMHELHVFMLDLQQKCVKKYALLTFKEV